MAAYSIKAQKREITGSKSQKLREQDLIPAVLYGPGIENQNISVKKQEFVKLHNEAGSSSLIDLEINDDKPVKTLIHDYQEDPKSGEITHVDFYQIQEGKKITTEVELEFVGEAPAVKALGGILVKNYDEVEIECLPADLEKIDTIKVDLSVLKEFNDSIHVKDLQTPEGIDIITDESLVVVMVSEPREEKIEEPVAKAEGEEAQGEVPEGESKPEDAKEGGEAKEEKSNEGQ